MLLDGAPTSFRSPREALDHGVAAIAQEPSLVPQLTVAENVFLGAEPRRGGFIRRRALRNAYAALVSEAGFELAGHARAGMLRTAEQQKTEILRAVSRDARIIVMDEPSAALSAPETAQLHEMIRSLVERKTTVLLISHFLREVLELADSVTVLRDGRVVRTSPTADETEASLVEAMLGRPLTTTFPAKRHPPADAPVALSVRDLHAPGSQRCHVRRSRRRDRRARRPRRSRPHGAHAGDLRRQPDRAGRCAPRGRAARAKPAPESRRRRRDDPGVAEGPGPALRALGRREYDARRGSRTQPRWHRAPRPRAALGACDPRPLRRARRELLGAGEHALGRQPAEGAFRADAARRPARPARRRADARRRRGREARDLRAPRRARRRAGMAIVLVSSELEEILGLAHRVLVMRAGRLVAELEGEAMTESAILAAAFADRSAGGSPPDPRRRDRGRSGGRAHARARVRALLDVDHLRRAGSSSPSSSSSSSSRSRASRSRRRSISSTSSTSSRRSLSSPPPGRSSSSRAASTSPSARRTRSQASSRRTSHSPRTRSWRCCSGSVRACSSAWRNGVLATVFRINALIATLATAFIVGGCASLITKGNAPRPLRQSRRSASSRGPSSWGSRPRSGSWWSP